MELQAGEGFFLFFFNLLLFSIFIFFLSNLLIHCLIGLILCSECSCTKPSWRAEDILQSLFVELTPSWREFQPDFLPFTELKSSAQSHPYNLKGHVWLHWCCKASLLASLIPHGAHWNQVSPPSILAFPMSWGAGYRSMWADWDWWCWTSEEPSKMLCTS